MSIFKGIWVPIVTPFHNDAIDFDAAQCLAYDLVNDGVHGIVVCGTTGEAAALDAKALEQFFKSNLCSRIEKSNMKKREQNFLCEMPAIPDKPNEEQIIVQGCVDCVFAEEDGLVIVDFKTSRLKTDQEFRDKYVKQLEIYSKAMSETYNLPIKEQIIYSLYLNKSISI